MKVSDQLFSKIFFTFSVFYFCIVITLTWAALLTANTVSQGSIRQVELIKVNDYEPWFYQYNYKNFDKKKTIKPTKLNLPSEPEFLSFGNALTVFGYNFDIKKFYNDYMNISIENLNEKIPLEGRLSIKTVRTVIENYIEKENIDVYCQDTSILIYDDLLKVIKNNWPTIVWYVKDIKTDVPLEKRWQISEVGLAYKIDDEKIYIFNPIERKNEIYNINEFKQYWEKSGAHALSI